MKSTRPAHDLHSKGQYLAAAPHPISTPSSVRVRDGWPLVTNGPFAETREPLGGYFLVGATDRDEAIGIAARIPGARRGTVEVRPIAEAPGLFDLKAETREFVANRPLKKRMNA